jgi:pre-mRNA-splicing factor CDC5/CEF1
MFLHIWWQAGSIVEDEIQYLRVAMGHGNGSFDDFVKAHDECQEDLMFFLTNSSYGLASVAGNADKISALQNEFEIVKKLMDEEAKKASRLEQKIKLLTQGYQVNFACYII